MPRSTNPSEMEQVHCLLKKLAADAIQTQVDLKMIKSAMQSMQENNPHQLNMSDLLEKIATLLKENPSPVIQAGPSTVSKIKINQIVMPSKPRDLKQLNSFAAGIINLLSTKQRKGIPVRPELVAHCQHAIFTTLMLSDDGDTSVSYELDCEKTLKMVLHFCRTLETGRLGEIGAQRSPLPQNHTSHRA